MDSQENKQVAIRGYEMFKSGNIQGILDTCADDIEWTSTESEYVPFSGTFHGKNGVGEFFTKLGQSWELQQFEPQNFIAEGDKVAVTGMSRGKAKPTGVEFEDRWVHIFTIRDGKIARFEQYGDSAAAVAAFMPTQAAGAQPGSTATARH